MSEPEPCLHQLKEQVRSTIRHSSSYQEIVEQVQDLLAQGPINASTKRVLNFHLDRFTSGLPQDPTDQQVVSHIDTYTAKHLPELVSRRPFSGKIYKLEISTDDWKEWEKKFEITPIRQEDRTDVAYRGGISRVLIRDLIEAPQNAADLHTTLDDVDLWARPELSKAYLSETYGADPKGVVYLKQLTCKEIANTFHNTDLTINHTGIMYDNMIASEAAIQSLQSGKSALTYSGKNFFGRQSYQKNNEQIATPKLLFRGLKKLLENKIETLSLPAHNLSPENIQTMHREKKFAATIRRWYHTDHPDKQYLTYQLCSLWCQLGVVSSPEEALGKLATVADTHPDFFQYDETLPDTHHDARRRLSKLAKNIFDTLDPDEATPPRGYDTSAKKQVALTYTAKPINEKFLTHLRQVEKQLLSDYL